MATASASHFNSAMNTKAETPRFLNTGTYMALAWQKLFLLPAAVASFSSVTVRASYLSTEHRTIERHWLNMTGGKTQPCNQVQTAGFLSRRYRTLLHRSDCRISAAFLFQIQGYLVCEGLF